MAVLQIYTMTEKTIPIKIEHTWSREESRKAKLRRLLGILLRSFEKLLCVELRPPNSFP